MHKKKRKTKLVNPASAECGFILPAIFYHWFRTPEIILNYWDTLTTYLFVTFSLVKL